MPIALSPLYDSDMRGAWALASLLVLSVAPAAAGAADDRLARFAELGRQLSEPAGGAAAADADAVADELFALVDDEMLDNLRSGGPFASEAFIQEQVDAFTSTWGGASFQVSRLGGARGEPPITLGVFTLPGPAPRGSVRAYGRGPGGQVARLTASTHAGVPAVHAWPPARGGGAQIVASWLGAASGAGGHPLTLELWRRGVDGVERTWTSAAAFPEGLWALGFSVAPGEIAIRREARYPGWKPGCAGQTEWLEVYRADARRDVALARRQAINGWHRDLQAAVERLFAALGRGDEAALAALVPDRALRARLPRTLAREPACDEPGPGAASAVVAATEERAGRMVPWSLAWRRGAGGWRLSAAARMLQ
jgi:hypothetical protein